MESVSELVDMTLSNRNMSHKNIKVYVRVQSHRTYSSIIVFLSILCINLVNFGGLIMK